MEIDINAIKVIGFDADDTLWVNETYFREAEDEFAKIMAPYETANKIDQELFKKEIENLSLYGYGIKGFILSMIESGIELSNNNLGNRSIQKIIEIGKSMLNKPVELLEGIEEVLQKLNQHYKIILVTKGDLLDQERKLKKSGLIDFFHHIEIVSDKKTDNYQMLLHGLDIEPHEFLMIGNSLKSDVIPLINIGAQAIHIPFHTTWIHEEIGDIQKETMKYVTLSSIKELEKILIVD